MSIRIPALLILAVLGFNSCREALPPSDYVVRVGNQYLLSEDLKIALASIPPGQDSLAARRQFVDQWVTSALLSDEARRRGLEKDSSIERRLLDSERSVLAAAMITRLYSEIDSEPTESDLAAYFAENRERLRIGEPFVLVRKMSNIDRRAANDARQEMLRIRRSPDSDSLWVDIASRYSADPVESIAVAGNYVPQSRIFNEAPEAQAALEQLSPSQISPLVQSGSAYYVVHLIDRAPAGTVPEIDWIRDVVSQQLRLQRRKQSYARQVERLRTEALSRGSLVVK